MGRGARRAVALGAAGVLVTAVVVLRGSAADDLDALLAEPRRTAPVVEEFAAATVTLPDPGPPPESPGPVQVRTEPDRLQVAWGPGLPGGRQPERAAGYQVRWSERGGHGGEALVAEPAVELAGLAPGRTYRVQVRSVDAVGRRSPPAFGSGTPGGTLGREPDTDWQQPYGFVDGFGGGGFDAAGADDTAQPDPTRWRVASADRFCLRAGAGTGSDAGRLVLALDCGTTVHTLMPAVSLRLAPRGSGELGRVAVLTDAAGSAGTLSIDLVPGPADVVGVDPGAPRPPAAPGTAAEDPALPPGTVRVLLGEAAPTVRTGPGVPRTGTVPGPDAEPARQAPGVTHRFEVVLRDDGLVVLRDGMAVAVADVRAPWTQARVLLGVAGPPGGAARIRLDAVGISGGAAPEAPGRTERDVVRPGRLVLPGTAPEPGAVPVPPGATSAQLRALLRPASADPLDDLTAVIGTAAVPVRPAVPGTAAVPGSVYPVLADVPAGLLSAAELPPVMLVSPASPGTEVRGAHLLFGGVAPARTLTDPPPALPANRAIPAVRVQVLDAAGRRLEPGRPRVRGPMVVEVRVDGADGQRRGPLAGLAGIELWLDGQRVAAVPTARDVPAVGGTHRFVVRTTERSAGPHSAGPHTVAVRAIPADPGVESRRTEVTLQLR